MSKLPTPNSQLPTPKVAIVCDWIARIGGAERVIHQLHKTFPDAPIYTSTYEFEDGALFKNADIRTAWFQRLPTFLRKYQLLTIPRQRYFSRLNLSQYDVVISAGSSEAKAVIVTSGAHINICYTPTLYYWVKPDNYLQKGTGGLNPLWRFGLKLLLPRMKKWDKTAAQNPDKMYALSSAVAERIETFYDRKSDGVIPPPVDIERFKNDNSHTRSGFVTFGRQVKHKRFELAITACNEIGAELVVVGNGPEHDYLRSIAGPTITFKTDVSDTDIVQYIASANAFIFPNEEDFGIVSVEAQAAGTPVIAYRGGGSLDTVIEGKTGEFFDEQTVESLTAALKDFQSSKYENKTITANAQTFSAATFTSNIKKAVEDTQK